MERTQALFAPLTTMPYDRMILFASCIALTLHGLWEFVVYVSGINLGIVSGGYVYFSTLDMRVAFYSPAGWLLFAMLCAKIVVFVWGTYFTLTRWYDNNSAKIFILSATVYLLFSALLTSLMFCLSPMWADLAYISASKGFYGSLKGLHILSVLVGCAIPLVVLLPRMKTLHLFANAQQLACKAQSTFKSNASLLREHMKHHMSRQTGTIQTETTQSPPSTTLSTEQTMTSSTEQSSTTMPPLSSHEQVKAGHGTIGDDMFVAFIGKNAQYYMQKFSIFGSLGGDFAVSWNWAGFFVPQLWFLYRKMYLFGIILLLVSICFPFIGWLLSSIVVGACGNHAYYTHATKKLLLLLASPVTQENRLAASAQLGGVNLALVLVIIGVNLLLAIVFWSFIAALFA